MLKKLLRRWAKKPKVEQAREALLEKVREATKQGSCVILSGTKDGTRVIVIGKPLVISQAEEILSKGVQGDKNKRGLWLRAIL